MAKTQRMLGTITTTGKEAVVMETRYNDHGAQFLCAYVTSKGVLRRDWVNEADFEADQPVVASRAVERLASRLSAGRASALLRSQSLVYWVSVLTFGAGLGVLPQLGTVTMLAVTAAMAGVVVLVVRRASPNEPASTPAAGPLALYPLFFGSGIAALVYQVVWQRSLFSLYGANIESTTVVVATFMFGLGLGGLLGGSLSTRFPNHAARIFLAIEFGIGAFGLISLPLIRGVAHSLATAPTWMISLSVFGLLCVPTLLMGATLPVLVAHVDRELKHVGQSVALLYAVNTAGSALACFLTVDTLFVWFGQSGAVSFAALCNLIVGALVFRFIRTNREVA